MTIRRESVTYRLATAGEQDVVGALAKIGETGENSARRLSQAYQKDLRLAEASVERLERRSKALLTLGGSDIQRRIASSTGLGAALPGGKSAEQSMQVFLQQQDQLEQSRARLLSQFNPLFAAQQRYNQVLAEANRLHAQGSLSQQELTLVQSRARQELQRTSVEYESMQKTSGATRVGIQQLGFQVSDFAVQVAGGTSAIRAFSLQGPQAVQALALMGQGADKTKGKFGAMARLLTGPWGAALTVAVSLIGVLSTKLFENEEAATKASSANLTLSDRLEEAKGSYRAVIAAIRDYNDELERSSETALMAAQRAYLVEKANLDQAVAIRKTIQAELELQSAREFDGSNVSGEGGFTVDTSAHAIRVGRLEERLRQNLDLIAEIERSVSNKGFDLASERARLQSDEAAAIAEGFENARLQVRRNIKDVDEQTAALARLNREEAAALEAVRSRGRRDRSAATEARKLQREAERQRQENARSLRSLIEASNPLAAIANQLRDDLTEIARLTSVAPSQGGIGSEQAGILSAQARQRASDARRSLFESAFSDIQDAVDEEDDIFAERAEFLSELRADQEAANRLLALEGTLLGASNSERDRALSRLALKEDLLARGIDLSREEVIALIQGNDALITREQLLAEANRELEAQQRIGENIIDTLFDSSQWDDFGELGKRIIRQLIQEMLVLAAINPLKNALYGSELPTAGNDFFGFLGGIFGNAIGAEHSAGGLRYVGEFGRELVRLPRGAQVINASRTRAMERSSSSDRAPSIFNISADGADPAQLQRLIDQVRELDRNLERRALVAATDLNDRTFGAAFAGPR